MKEGIKPVEYYPGIFDKFKVQKNLDRWIELGFDELMWGLGYDMDCAKSFKQYVQESPLKVKAPKTIREEKRNNLYFLEHAEQRMVGNYLFSCWRGYTHWVYFYDEYDVDYLHRIIRILEDSYPQKAKKRTIEDFVNEIDFPEMELLGKSGTYAYYAEKYTDPNQDTGIPIVIFEDEHTSTFMVCNADDAMAVLARFADE